MPGNERLWGHLAGEHVVVLVLVQTAGLIVYVVLAGTEFHEAGHRGTDDLEALEETIAVLSDEAAVRQLATSDAELARGEGESVQDLADAMRQRRPTA